MCGFSYGDEQVTDPVAEHHHCRQGYHHQGNPHVHLLLLSTLVAMLKMISNNQYKFVKKKTTKTKKAADSVKGYVFI